MRSPIALQSKQCRRRTLNRALGRNAMWSLLWAPTIRRSPRKRAGNDLALLPFAQTLTDRALPKFNVENFWTEVGFSKSATEAEQKAEVGKRGKGLERPDVGLLS